jgi:hypothetical protein
MAPKSREWLDQGEAKVLSHIHSFVGSANMIRRRRVVEKQLARDVMRKPEQALDGPEGAGTLSYPRHGSGTCASCG